MSSPAPVLCLALALLQARSLAQQTAIVTGGFNGYEGARDGCELINKAHTSPHTPQRHFSQQFLPESQGVECLDMGTSRFV